MNEETNKLWTKLFGSTVYVIVYHDPYAHSECEECCCSLESTSVMGVASSLEMAEQLIARYQKRVPYRRKDFDIEEMKLDGGINE